MNKEIKLNNVRFYHIDEMTYGISAIKRVKDLPQAVNELLAINQEQPMIKLDFDKAKSPLAINARYSGHYIRLMQRYIIFFNRVLKIMKKVTDESALYVVSDNLMVEGTTLHSPHGTYKIGADNIDFEEGRTYIEPAYKADTIIGYVHKKGAMLPIWTEEKIEIKQATDIPAAPPVQPPPLVEKPIIKDLEIPPEPPKADPPPPPKPVTPKVEQVEIPKPKPAPIPVVSSYEQIKQPRVSHAKVVVWGGIKMAVYSEHVANPDWIKEVKNVDIFHFEDGQDFIVTQALSLFGDFKKVSCKGTRFLGNMAIRTSILGMPDANGIERIKFPKRDEMPRSIPIGVKGLFIVDRGE